MRRLSESFLQADLRKRRTDNVSADPNRHSCLLISRIAAMIMPSPTRVLQLVLLTSTGSLECLGQQGETVDIYADKAKAAYAASALAEAQKATANGAATISVKYADDDLFVTGTFQITWAGLLSRFEGTQVTQQNIASIASAGEKASPVIVVRTPEFQGEHREDDDYLYLMEPPPPLIRHVFTGTPGQTWYLAPGGSSSNRRRYHSILNEVSKVKDQYVDPPRAGNTIELLSPPWNQRLVLDSAHNYLVGVFEESNPDGQSYLVEYDWDRDEKGRYFPREIRMRLRGERALRPEELRGFDVIMTYSNVDLDAAPLLSQFTRGSFKLTPGTRVVHRQGNQVRTYTHGRKDQVNDLFDQLRQAGELSRGSGFATP